MIGLSVRNAVLCLIGWSLGVSPAPAETNAPPAPPLSEKERSDPHVEATGLRPAPEARACAPAVIAASDGNTYFVFSSDVSDRSGRLYRYAPYQKKLTPLLDVDTWCGLNRRTGPLRVRQDISGPLVEGDGRLFCVTRPVNPPQNLETGGGYFLYFGLQDGEHQNLGRYPDPTGGLMTVLYEPNFDRLYAISAADQTLCYYPRQGRRIITVGPCRENPRAEQPLIADEFGNVYGCDFAGAIWKFHPVLKEIQSLEARLPSAPDVRQPPETPDNPAYQRTGWACILYDPVSRWWYGVRGNDEYLFRLRLPEDADGSGLRIEGLARLSGTGDQTPANGASTGLCRLGRTLWYVSPTPDGRGTNLVSYDIDDRTVTRHGPIGDDDGRRVKSVCGMVVGSDKNLHAVADVWSLPQDTPSPGEPDRPFHGRFVIIDPENDLKKPIGSIP